MKTTLTLLATLIFTAVVFGQTENERNRYYGPIIDMHAHVDLEENIPNKPTAYCIPLSNIIEYYDPKDGNYGDLWWGAWENPTCDNPIWMPTSYQEYKQSFKDAFIKHDVIAVMSGTDPKEVLKWYKEMPDRIIPSLQFRIGESKISTDSLRILVEDYALKGLGEITNQYHGIEINDKRMYPYYELAQELDIPVGIHLGSGLPGIPYYMYPQYRASLSLIHWR